MTICKYAENGKGDKNIIFSVSVPKIHFFIPKIHFFT